MAANGRSTYSTEDKARVIAVLLANGGNIKRTARETGVPINTVRRWKGQNNDGAGPPAPVVAAAVGEFVDEAREVRGMALAVLKAKLAAGEVDARTAVTVVGILDDKVRLATGMPTARTEHTAQLPSPDEVRTLLQGYGAALLEGAQRRNDEIVEAEVVAEIPAAT